MSAIDPLDEQKAVRLRQRLWGAAVLIALLVIFLPLLLDGAGSESQYRRVERLRAEPPRVIDAQGVLEPAEPVTDRSNDVETVRPIAVEAVDNEVMVKDPVIVPNDTSGLAAQPQNPAIEPSPQVEPLVKQSAEPLKAWVVQAGSFGDEVNALAVRDKLRRAGFPSFVTPTDSATPLYRVRVGPMINLQQAEINRDKVMQLLSREAIVVSYP